MTAEKKSSQPSTRGKSKGQGTTSSKRATSKPAGVSPREQAEVLIALQETLFDITKGLSLPELLKAMVERAVKLLQAHGGGLYLNEPDEQRVRCVVSYKTPQDYRGTVLAYDEGAAGRVAKTGKPLMIADYRVWSGRAEVFEKEHPFQAVICAPMKWQGKISGVFSVLRDEKFTRKDLELLTLFANHAAVAVENARLVRSVEQELGERERAQAALLASEEQYRTLFENMTQGYAYCKMIYKGKQAVDWIYLVVNPAFESLTGLKNATGKRVTELIPNIRKVDPELFRIYARVSESAKPEKFEYFLDSLQMWFSVSVSSPQHGYFMAVFDIITERKQAEQALRESETKSRELFEVAQRQAQELSLLDMVRTAITQELDLDALLHRVVESISEVFGYTLVSLYMLEGENLILQHQVGYERVIETIPKTRGITGRVVRTGKAVFLKDIKEDAEFLGAFKGILSEICVPLLDHGKPVGVLNIESTKGVWLTEADLNLMNALSAHVGMAISRARLYGDIQQRNRILSALQESTLALMKQTNLSDTLRSIIEQAGLLVNSSDGYIYLVEPDESAIRVILGVGIYAKYEGKRLKPNEGLAGKVWQTGKPLHVKDYMTWEGRSDQYADLPFHAVIGVPLIYNSRVMGILGLAHLDPKKSFSENDADILGYFSRLASIALENSRLFTRVQQELQDRNLVEQSLRKAESQYRELVERLPLVVYTSELGSEGVWKYVSPRIENLLGFSAEEWMADPRLWYRQLHPEDRESHQNVEDRAYAARVPFEDEYRIFKKDGTQIWVRDSGVILPPEGDGPPTVQGVLTDVTERREMRDALQESEHRYRLLVDSSPSAIALHQGGRIIFVNESAVRLMHAKNEDELIGKPIMDLVHPDYRQVVQERVRKSVEENQPGAVIEEKFLRLDGTTVDVEVSSSALTYKGAPAVQVIVHDITERKHSEEALRLAEEKYRSLIEQMPLVVYLDNADDSSTSFYISPQIEKLLGYPASEYVKNPKLWHEQVLPEDYEFALATVRRTLEVGEAAAEYRLAARDGRVVWVRDTSVLVRDDNGEPKFIQGFLEDITEQKRSQTLQESVYEIARAGMITQSLDELYAKIHAVLQNLLPTQFFYIAIYDRDQDLVSFPYFQDAYDEAPPPSKPGRGLTEYVLRTRQPILANSEVTERLTRAGEIELIGADSIEWLGAPLIVHDEAIGVMVVQSYDETIHFSQRDMEVLTYVSTQVANAIERKRAEEALQRSEAFARSIVENEPECVKIVGPGGALQYMNPAGLAMIEVSDLSLVRGKSVYPIVVPEHRPAFQELTERVLRGEQGTLQFEVIGLRGMRRWLDTQAVPLFDEQGKPYALLGITRDITKRKQAEALQEAVYRITKAAETTDSIRDLFPQIHQIISSVMPAENFFITLYDETHNLLEFPYFHDALDEPYLDKIEPGMGLTAYVLRTGKSLLCTQAVHDDLEARGEVKLLGVPSKIWLGVPLIVEGRAIGVMVVQHYTDPDAYGVREQNILEFVSSQIATTIQRKQSEQALRESEGRYRTLFKGMLDGVYRSTHDGRFLDVNPAMVRLFGYSSREEMLEIDIKKDLYFAPEERESLFLDTGQEKVDVFRMKRKDGSEIWVEDHGHYVHDERGNVIYHEGILRDVTDRIRAEHEISRLLQESQQRLRHVEALRSIDLAIGSSMDLRTTLNILLSYVKSLLAVDAADILLFNRNSQSFEFAASNGFRSRVSDAAFHAMGRNFASRVALERRITQFRDPSEVQNNRELSALWKAEGFVTYTGVPLIAKGDLKGVLEIHHRSVFHPETQWMELVQNFSTQAAIAIENAQLFNDLQNTNFELSLAYDATIEGWSKALELRGNEPPGHFHRVTELTLTLARAMGIRDAELIHVRRGALLHDIGKMAIPDSILRKTGPLDEEEWGLMRQHPVYARDLLAPIAYLRPAIDIPLSHHEKWDGTGYPNGLRGDAIPMAARVFAIADVYDISTSDHFYRKGLSKEKAVEYIKSESGKHFDPSVVGAFLQLLSKGDLVL